MLKRMDKNVALVAPPNVVFSHENDFRRTAASLAHRQGHSEN